MFSDWRPKHLLTLMTLSLLGPLLMYAGDLLMYFQSADTDAFYTGLIEFMRDKPRVHLHLGAILGPVSAPFYILGFIGIAVTVKGPAVLRYTLVGLLTVSICIGSAYHAGFPHMVYATSAVQSGEGFFFDRLPEDQASYFMLLLNGYLIPAALAWITFSIMIILGRTHLPRWFIVFSPVVWYWLAEPFHHLSPPLNVLIAGGWFNLQYLPMFGSVALWAFLQRSETAPSPLAHPHGTT